MNKLAITNSDATHNWVYVNGELTHSTCLDFLETMESHLSFNGECLTLDCSDLKSIDGDGVGALVALYTSLWEQRKKLQLHNLRGQPCEVLTVLGIVNFFVETMQCSYSVALKNS